MSPKQIKIDYIFGYTPYNLNKYTKHIQKVKPIFSVHSAVKLEIKKDCKSTRITGTLSMEQRNQIS